MRRGREEQGFALITAIILLTVILGLGAALLTFSDHQQTASLREQASESSFNVAEAALNAQVGQLSRAWPAKKEEAYPSVCTSSTSTETNGCPTAASLNAAYPNISPVPCSSGTPKDPWGSALTNEWTTYVRDNESVGSTTFNSTVEKGLEPWDANGDGKVWVRSVGVVQCRLVTVISLISRQLVTLNFPTAAASGNWFNVTNEGNKVIVNTAGEPPGQPGEISMRCEGHSPCESWSESKGQISPNTTKSPPLPTPLLNESQLAALRSQAISNGTFRSPTVKGCPSNVEEVAGLPAYVEGCGALKFTGGVGNAAGKPGFLVLADGTLELKGNAEFFGTIYAHNASNYSGAVVVLGGTAQVIGGIDVDGNGGIEFGSSKANLIYNKQAIEEVKAYAGATPTRNTFRVLPATR
jgi:Tfp pilus assembly protein PilX